MSRPPQITIESPDQDPILRLDQMIHRHDQIIELLKTQNNLIRALALEIGVLISMGCVIIILIWPMH